MEPPFANSSSLGHFLDPSLILNIKNQYLQGTDSPPYLRFSFSVNTGVGSSKESQVLNNPEDEITE